MAPVWPAVANSVWPTVPIAPTIQPDAVIIVMIQVIRRIQYAPIARLLVQNAVTMPNAVVKGNAPMAFVPMVLTLSQYVMPMAPHAVTISWMARTFLVVPKIVLIMCVHAYRMAHRATLVLVVRIAVADCV